MRDHGKFNEQRCARTLRARGDEKEREYRIQKTRGKRRTYWKRNNRKQEKQRQGTEEGELRKKGKEIKKQPKSR